MKDCFLQEFLEKHVHTSHITQAHFPISPAGVRDMSFMSIMSFGSIPPFVVACL